MDALNEANKEFLIESQENLEQLDRDLLALEEDPAAPAAIARIFRAVHTFKGSAGFLGFAKLESLSHTGESLLSRLRDGKLAVTHEIISALLALVDALREILAAVEQTGQDGSKDYADLIALLRLLREDTGSAGGAAVPAVSPGTLPKAPAEPAESPSVPESRSRPTEAVERNELPAAAAVRAGDLREPARQRIVTTKEDAAAGHNASAAALAQQSIRLDIRRLDKLMNLVSELVLARNHIVQHSTTVKDAVLTGACRQLNLITSELQEEVMAVRLQPIGNVWGKFPRLVRDLAASCGKEVNLELIGSDTGLDKAVLEAMKDPLTHLIRNAIDHGIEDPERRRLAGKPAAGKLELRAYHEGGQVFIEMADDGAGIEPAKIKTRAVERGLITPQRAATLSDESALDLIFLPGFSTAATVTSLSGRGVGMDIVKNNIEKIGGTVDVHSKAGVGTTIKLRLPPTLAIIRSLIVLSGGQRYAIPQASVVELIRLEGAKVHTAIDSMHGAVVYRYRGKLLPLAYLKRLLDCPSLSASAGAAETVNIVVLQAEERTFGLVVDRIIDTQEIVVKPLGKLVRGIPSLAGATIMGDGRVALILDVHGLGERSGVLAGAAAPVPPPDEAAVAAAAVAAAAAAAVQDQLVLLQGPGSERLAVPLGMVVRLEELATAAIECVGTQLVVQYRDHILPLVDVAAILEKCGPGDVASLRRRGERLPMVVCTAGTRSVGLVADRVLDVLAHAGTIKGRSTRPHVLFTTIVKQQVTEVLDVAGLMHVGQC